MNTFNLEAIPAPVLETLCSAVLEAAERFYAMDDENEKKEEK